MEKSLIIYHRVDYDGQFSCLVIKNWLESKGEMVDYIGFNYGDVIPDINPSNYKTIYMVDISYPSEDMIYLKNTGKLIWIDHHISAIEKSIEGGFNDIPGIRDIGKAATELCWKWAWGEKEIPLSIQYISAYDVWNKLKFDWETTTLPFQYALRQRYTGIVSIDDHFTELLENNDLVNSLIEEGKLLLDFLKKQWKSWVKVYGFPVLVGGKWKGICVCSTQFGSSMFWDVLKNYDIYIVVNKRGATYSLSMYKEPDRIPEFSCATFMRSLNDKNGGHASAAGGTITLQEFIRLIDEGKLG